MIGNAGGSEDAIAGERDPEASAAHLPEAGNTAQIRLPLGRDVAAELVALDPDAEPRHIVLERWSKRYVNSARARAELADRCDVSRTARGR